MFASEGLDEDSGAGCRGDPAFRDVVLLALVVREQPHLDPALIPVVSQRGVYGRCRGWPGCGLPAADDCSIELELPLESGSERIADLPDAKEDLGLCRRDWVATSSHLEDRGIGSVAIDQYPGQCHVLRNFRPVAHRGITHVDETALRSGIALQPFRGGTQCKGRGPRAGLDRVALQQVGRACWRGLRREHRRPLAAQVDTDAVGLSQRTEGADCGPPRGLKSGAAIGQEQSHGGRTVEDHGDHRPRLANLPLGRGRREEDQRRDPEKEGRRQADPPPLSLAGAGGLCRRPVHQRCNLESPSFAAQLAENNQRDRGKQEPEIGGGGEHESRRLEWRSVGVMEEAKNGGTE